MNEVDIEAGTRPEDEAIFEEEDEILEWRPWHLADLVELKRLHEEWFPIRYKETFYSHACEQRVWNSTQPLFTAVCSRIINRSEVSPPSNTPRALSTSDVTRHGNNAPTSSSSHMGSVKTPPRFEGYTPGVIGAGPDLYGRGSRLVLPSRRRNREGIIQEVTCGVDEQQFGARGVIGAVTAQIMPLSKCEDQDLFDPGLSFNSIAYILTLGTHTSYRRRGLSTALLKLCEQHAHCVKTCGAVYLHVITYNRGACRFYARNGYRCLREVENYYSINGVQVRFMKNPYGPALSML